MDPRDNPYSPGAGTRPPELAGRDAELEQFEVLLSRLSAGRSARSMIVTGLRGVGKTVLLNRFEALAQSHGWFTAQREITTATVLPEDIARIAGRALRTLSPARRVRDRVERLLDGLTSFKLATPEGFELAYDPRSLRSRSGAELGDDFADLFVALGEAAVDKDRGVLILLDEAQFLDRRHFEAVLAGLHRVAQLDLPMAVVGAGLPQLPRLAGEAKSYAERLFTFPAIGRLSDEAAADALRVPAERQGARFEPHALARILKLADGYPYFLQEYGSAVWNVAKGPRITRRDVDDAQVHVRNRLDDGFFHVRFSRATEQERRYMSAMASLGEGPQRSGAVAGALGRTPAALSPIRDGLIKKGLVYSPERGLLDFTVPQFADFMRRTAPLA